MVTSEVDEYLIELLEHLALLTPYRRENFFLVFEIENITNSYRTTDPNLYTFVAETAEILTCNLRIHL